jgi:hypothetical protein
MENKLKVTRPNTFYFVGRAVITDKSFAINKTNENGTWCHNSMFFGVDCGDHGINYITGMGGYNPTRENYIQVSTIDAEGKIQTKDHDIKIDWDERFDIPEETMNIINKQRLIYTKVEKDASGNPVARNFLSMYDAVAHIQKHVSNGTPIYVRGRIEMRPSEDGQEWSTQHIVDSIGLAGEENFTPRTELKINVLIDQNTIGKPDADTKTLPLFCKTITYVNKVGQNKYNQACAAPLKIVVDLNKFVNPTTGEPDKNKLLYAHKNYFTPNKKGMVAEGVFVCHYVGGVQKVEITLDDLPTEIREGIENGVLDKDHIMKSLAITKPIERQISYITVDSYNKIIQTDDSEIPLPTMIFEKDKYKENEIVEFADLEPIETAPTASSANSTAKASPVQEDVIDDVDNEDITNILNMLGN